MPSGSLAGGGELNVMMASGYCGKLAFTRSACPAPVPATEHTTEAPGNWIASAALSVFCNCDARPATVCGIGVPCANTVAVTGREAGAVVGSVTLNGTVNAAVATAPITVAVVLVEGVPV